MHIMQISLRYAPLPGGDGSKLGGSIAAANRGDGSGAILTLRFPLRAAAYNTGQPA